MVIVLALLIINDGKNLHPTSALFFSLCKVGPCFEIYQILGKAEK